MKTPVVVGIVVVLHCLAIGSLVLMQGCGTTPPQPPVVTPVQPPVPAEPEVKPAVAPPRAPRFEPPVAVEKVPATVETKTYTVEKGDSLSLIAKRFNVGLRDIMQLNAISNPNNLRVGQKLHLPGYVNLSAPKPVVKPKPAKPKIAAAGGEYEVKSGDSLWLIARAHGTSVSAIRQANSLTSDSLKVGQKLKIPGSTAASAPAPAPARVAEAEGAPAETGIQPPAAAPMGEPAVVPDKPGMVTHIVDANQELGEIAMMYGISLDDLMKINGLTNAAVKAGTVLKIPAAGL